MKPKMGRPKVPKAKLRAILMQTRVSTEENRAIEDAIGRSKEPKSTWMRKALLAATSGQKTVA